MDHNIRTRTDSNRIDIFNAVKNKVDNQEAAEKTSFSPPIFSIPLLKISGDATDVDHENTQKQPNSSATQLNQFLLKQLQEKHSKNDFSKCRTGFVLPELQSSTETGKPIEKFELPVLKSQSASATTESLTRAINKLQVQEKACEDVLKPTASAHSTIDLSIALAAKLETHHNIPSTRDLMKPQQHNEIDFEIPFIDCDRLDLSRKSNIILPASNEYCVTDVSKLLLQHSLTTPSAIGYFLSIEDNKYLPPLPLTIHPQRGQQKVNHILEPFHFDTNSPDDVVLLNLSKYHRPHYK